MNKLNSIIVLLLFVCLGFMSCDDSPGNALDETNEFSIRSLSVDPSSISFQSSDGVKDTTITVSIEAVADIDAIVSGEATPVEIFYAVFDQSDDEIPIAEGIIQPSEGIVGLYGASFELNLNTTSSTEFNCYVYQFNQASNSWLSARIEVQGFASQPPVILEASNPERVVIPSGSQVAVVPFTAKVFDPDGQDNIDRVSIIFRNEDGSLLIPADNILQDDGLAASGDEVAGDSTYTITFQIDQNNTPNNRTALYFAIDKTGLSSDTVEVPFNIVEDE